METPSPPEDWRSGSKVSPSSSASTRRWSIPMPSGTGSPRTSSKKATTFPSWQTSWDMKVSRRPASICGARPRSSGTPWTESLPGKYQGLFLGQLRDEESGILNYFNIGKRGIFYKKSCRKAEKTVNLSVEYCVGTGMRRRKMCTSHNGHYA